MSIFPKVSKFSTFSTVSRFSTVIFVSRFLTVSRFSTISTVSIFYPVSTFTTISRFSTVLSISRFLTVSKFSTVSRFQTVSSISRFHSVEGLPLWKLSRISEKARILGSYMIVWKISREEYRDYCSNRIRQTKTEYETINSDSFLISQHPIIFCSLNIPNSPGIYDSSNIPWQFQDSHHVQQSHYSWYSRQSRHVR